MTDQVAMANWLFMMARRLNNCPPHRREQEMGSVGRALKQQAQILMGQSPPAQTWPERMGRLLNKMHNCSCGKTPRERPF